MDFVCTLQWQGTTKAAILSKAILAIHKANVFLKSQKQENDTQGNKFVHIHAQTRGKDKITDVEASLATLEDFKLITIIPGNSLEAISTKIDRKAALDSIAQSYPDISKTVAAFANSQPEETRNEALYALGKSVGGGVYKRDFSLGSPLPVPATLSRELVKALKAFSGVSLKDDTIIVKKSPFCSVDKNAVSCCEFTTGFIFGFLDKNPAADVESVRRSSCCANGSKECSFKIK